MRYLSLAFRTLSLLDLMSSFAISMMLLAEWSLVRKCSETGGFRDSRWVVNCSAVFVKAVFESSVSFTSALFGTVVALYHVNDVFGVTVNVISDRPGFACSVECVRKFVPRYVLHGETVFSAWVWAPGLVVLWDCEVSALTRKSVRLLLHLSYDGCSFKDVIATGGWNKDVKLFANNGWDGTKGWVVGDNKGNTLWFVQCGSVMGRKCFCPCDIVNSLYFPLKEIVVITTFVKIVSKFIGA